MRSRSPRLFFFGFFLFSFLSVTLPLPADAALVPCGRSSGTAEEQAPCTACHLIVGGKGVIDYGLQIMTYIAIAVIVAMAIFYIVSSGNEGMMQTAKSGIKAALIGFAVMLAAWLIVNTTLNLIAVKDTDPNNPLFGLRQNGAFTFSCDTSSSANVAAGTPSNTPGFVATSGATAVSVPANGILAVPAGSSVFFPSATVVITPAAGIITLSNGTTQSVLSGSTVTVPAGATLSFPSGAVTLTLPQGGTPTLLAANSSASDSRNNTAPATLSIVRDGEGTVTGSGIDCRTDCQELYPSATSITLTATPAQGFLFASWGGACSGNSPTCTVSMTEARSVTADFIPIPPPGTFLLSVAKEGSGTGTVTGSGIDCGTDCSETYTNNPTITLTATPGPNSVFVDWFGACSGTGACSIPMTGTQKVTASFQSTLVAGGAETNGGGGGSCANYGDPGSGLWIPPNTTGRVVADKTLNFTVSYIPGCLGKPAPNCSSCGCALNTSYTQNGITAALGGGKKLLLRYKTGSTVTNGKHISVDAFDGSNVGYNMKVWLSTDPTATYGSVSTACKDTSWQHPTIGTGAEASVTLTQTAFGNTTYVAYNYCKLEPDTVYYFGIEYAEAMESRFQVDGMSADFLSTPPGPSAACVNSGAASQCGALPAGTTIYTAASPEPSVLAFDKLFDLATTQTVMQSSVAPGKTKAYQFTNDKAYVTGNVFTFYATGPTDMSISACPGDFNVPEECKSMGKMGTRVYWSKDGADYNPYPQYAFMNKKTCNIGAGKTVYLNFRGAGSDASSIQVSNTVTTK